MRLFDAICRFSEGNSSFMCLSEIWIFFEEVDDLVELGIIVLCQWICADCLLKENTNRRVSIVGGARVLSKFGLYNRFDSFDKSLCCDMFYEMYRLCRLWNVYRMTY